jgi:site-specific DNA-methyltransferase (adenine-specific)
MMHEPFIQNLPGAVLWRGEAWEVLRGMDSGSVDALVTDPPYSSGGLHKGARSAKPVSKYLNSNCQHLYADFEGDNRDGRSFSYWMTLWLTESYRVLKPGAVAAVFSDWRQLPSTTDAFQAAGFTWRGIVVWDKTQGSRPQLGRFRAQAEYVIWGSKGEMPKCDTLKVHPGVFQHFPKAKDKQHIAGKPVALMRDLIGIVPEGSIVLDPFAGSGSTGVAALETGRKFIGVEMSEHYFEIMRSRLANVGTRALEHSSTRVLESVDGSVGGA